MKTRGRRGKISFRCSFFNTHRRLRSEPGRECKGDFSPTTKVCRVSEWLMKRELALKAVVAVEAAPPQLAKRHAFSETLATHLTDNYGPKGLFPSA